VHKRAVKVWDTDSSVMDIWIKYLEANALGGVGMRVVRWDREEVGFGAKRKEYVLARLEKTLRGHRGEVRDLGEKIVEAEKKASEAAKQQAPPPSTSSDAGEASPST
jgi:small subunit ribosomal protein S10